MDVNELSRDDLKRCRDFLILLGIDTPDHRFLSRRGYFNIFLSGLRPEDVGKHQHPSVQEFRGTIQILAKLGVERVRSLIVLGDELEEQPEPDPPSSPSGVYSKSFKKNDLADPPSSSGIVHKKASTKDIRIERPSNEELRHYRELEHADSPGEAITYARQRLHEKEFHEAYHIIFDYFLKHPLNESVLRAASEIIEAGGEFNRARGIPPENMLFECEELAIVLAKRIPNIKEVVEDGGEYTKTVYTYVKIIYNTWISHCMQLLNYKYSTATGEMVRRNWIDPQEFGFLVDVMRTGIRTGLPLHILRYIYRELRKCVDFGKEIIAHSEKRSQFEGDVLRFLASPSRDLIPDLTLLIYKDITHAYLAEGDTATALTFCKQCLMLKKTDREMLQLKDELENRGALRTRKGEVS